MKMFAISRKSSPNLIRRRDTPSPASTTYATPLVLGHASRLLAAVTLGAFPSTATTDTRPSDRTDHQPVLLRRAIELLHGLDGKQWHRRKGTNRSQLYFPPQVVPNGIVVGSSRNHNAHASESSSGPDSNWREPLGITQVVPVFPPLMGGNREPLEFYGT